MDAASSGFINQSNKIGLAAAAVPLAAIGFFVWILELSRRMWWKSRKALVVLGSLLALTCALGAAARLLGEPTPPVLTVTGTYSPDPLARYCIIDGKYAIVPVAVSSAPRVLSLDGLRHWLSESRAVDGGETTYTFTVQAAEDRNVVVTGLDTVLYSRSRSTMTGVPVRVDSNGCGAEPVDVYSATIDLDEENPVPVVEDVTTGRRVRTFDFVVTNVSPLIVEVTGYTTRTDVTWGLDLHYSFDGGSRVLSLPGDGSEFRTDPTGKTPGFTYLLNTKSYLYHAEPGCLRILEPQYC